MVTPTRISKIRTADNSDLARVQDSIARTMEPVAQALGRTPIMGAAAPPWQRPIYAADFIDGVPQTAFHKDALGYVWLKLNASTAAGAVALATLFTLPLGLRPSEVLIFVGVNPSTGAINPLLINPSGVVQTVPAIAAGQGVAGYLSFLAEQ